MASEDDEVRIGLFGGLCDAQRRLAAAQQELLRVQDHSRARELLGDSAPQLVVLVRARQGDGLVPEQSHFLRPAEVAGHAVDDAEYSPVVRRQQRTGL